MFNNLQAFTANRQVRSYCNTHVANFDRKYEFESSIAVLAANHQQKIPSVCAFLNRVKSVSCSTRDKRSEVAKLLIAFESGFLAN